ncbi:10870_t:CDS:1, partial [Racocetra persica]
NNKPKAKEPFEFLNPHLKLSERQTLNRKVLDATIAEENEAMYDALCKNKIDIILTFDRWTNVNNKQLLEVMIITSEGKPYVWKATDISLERESHIKVIEKTNTMINELK